MGRRGLGGTWQQVLSPACQSLLHHFTRLFSEPRRAPHSPCGQGRDLGNGQVGRGQAEACPPQGNQHSPHLPTPPTHSHREYPSGGQPQGTTGETRGGKGWRRGRKYWKEEGLHSLAHSLCACSPHSLLWSHSNTESWGLREEARGRGIGDLCHQSVGGQMGRWGLGQEVLSLSLFPCRFSPGPAAHPILKAHGPQTSPPLLYPDLALHTEQLEASEDGQHSALSPWPRGLSGSGLSHSHRKARTKKTPQRVPQSNCTTTAATERGHFL